MKKLFLSLCCFYLLCIIVMMTANMKRNAPAGSKNTLSANLTLPATPLHAYSFNGAINASVYSFRTMRNLFVPGIRFPFHVLLGCYSTSARQLATIANRL